MLRVLRQRDFGLLWFGGFVSNLGDWVLFVGLPFEIYTRTGSTLATGAMVLSFLIPNILLGSVAGVFVDRWDRRRLMIVVTLLQAGSLLPLLLVGQLGLWIVYAVLVTESSISQLFNPAQTALVPSLLAGGADELVTANAVTGVGQNAARLIGPAFGGAIVAAGGLGAIAAIDAGSFVFSAAMIALIQARAARPPASDTLEHVAASAWRRVVHEWRDGLRVIQRAAVLRALLAFSVITSIGEGLTAALFVVWVLQALHWNAGGYGWVLSVQAIGGLAGALVIAWLGPRVRALPLLIGGALAFGGIDLVLFTYPAFWPVIWPALVILVIVGVPGAAMGAARTTLIQSETEDSHRGRVAGAMSAMGGLGALVGASVAGVLGQVVPVIPLLIVQGSGYLAAGTAVWLMVRRRASAEEAAA